MKAVILAGGKGTRLAPYTTVFPKPLMPIDGMPILEIIVRQLAAYDIKDLTFSVSQQSEYLIKAYFGDGSKWGVKIEYSKEEQPLGTAGPLSLIPELPITFLVMNGDVLTTLDYISLINYHRTRHGLVTIATHKRTIYSNLGVMEQDCDSSLIKYTEKPSIEYLVSMGVYVFDKAIMAYIPKNKYLDFPVLIQQLLNLKQKVLCYPSYDFWLDIGQHEDYAKAQEVFPKIRKELLYE